MTKCADRSIPQQLQWFREGLGGAEPVLAVNLFKPVLLKT